MKLSFVIPAHNEEQYIGKCLDSIFEAIGDDPDIEVIVVDNNSTDKTAAVVAQYSKAKLLREHKPGANSARQAGYLAAKAKLIANVDADTLVDKDWVNHAIGAFAANPKLVGLSGPFIYYDLPQATRFLVKLFYFLSYLSYAVNRFVFRRASVIQGGNYVVNKSALDAIGGYNTDLTFYGDDADLARRLNKVGKVKFTFDFPIYSSGRRLATEGTFTMGLRYGLNYFWIVLFGKPFSTTSIIVRPKQINGKLQYESVNTINEWMSAVIMFAILGIVLTIIVGIPGFLIYKLAIYVLNR